MELTAEALQQIAFGAKVRGYDPEQVDKFIDDVIEAGEELHERLRRATDRAVQAEQKLAASASQPAPVAASAPVSAASMGEMSKIWEKAAAAADSALEEARQEAARIRDDARRESDEQIGKARREAAAMAEESQAQLRSDIQRLESARDRLKTDVDGLSSYLQNEKSRLRDTIAGALSALDSYGDDSSNPPALSQVDVPAQPASDPTPAPWGQPAAQQQSSFSGWNQPDEGSRTETSSQSESDWAAPAPQERTEPGAQKADEEEEGDPFLAELRRAVRDDGPLGPREDEPEEDSIDNLYASDDDKNFFRRKK